MRRPCRHSENITAYRGVLILCQLFAGSNRLLFDLALRGVADPPLREEPPYAEDELAYHVRPQHEISKPDWKSPPERREISERNGNEIREDRIAYYEEPCVAASAKDALRQKVVAQLYDQHRGYDRNYLRRIDLRRIRDLEDIYDRYPYQIQHESADEAEDHTNADEGLALVVRLPVVAFAYRVTDYDSTGCGYAHEQREYDIAYLGRNAVRGSEHLACVPDDNGYEVRADNHEQITEQHRQTHFQILSEYLTVEAAKMVKPERDDLIFKNKIPEDYRELADTRYERSQGCAGDVHRGRAELAEDEYPVAEAVHETGYNT